jgi:hypothetical protein
MPSMYLCAYRNQLSGCRHKKCEVIYSNSQFLKNQQMHYIINYCSLSPTYVSVPVEPSLGDQGYIQITSIS